MLKDTLTILMNNDHLVVLIKERERLLVHYNACSEKLRVHLVRLRVNEYI